VTFVSKELPVWKRRMKETHFFFFEIICSLSSLFLISRFIEMQFIFIVLFVFESFFVVSLSNSQLALTLGVFFPLSSLLSGGKKKPLKQPKKEDRELDEDDLAFKEKV
jgi:hypothetical protein